MGHFIIEISLVITLLIFLNILCAIMVSDFLRKYNIWFKRISLIPPFGFLILTPILIYSATIIIIDVIKDIWD